MQNIIKICSIHLVKTQMICSGFQELQVRKRQYRKTHLWPTQSLFFQRHQSLVIKAGWLSGHKFSKTEVFAQCHEFCIFWRPFLCTCLTSGQQRLQSVEKRDLYCGISEDLIMEFHHGFLIQRKEWKIDEKYLVIENISQKSWNILLMVPIRFLIKKSSTKVKLLSFLLSGRFYF